MSIQLVTSLVPCRLHPISHIQQIVKQLLLLMLLMSPELVELLSIQVSGIILLLEISFVVTLVAAVLPDSRGFLLEEPVVGILEMISTSDKIIELFTKFLLLPLGGAAVAEDLFEFLDAGVLNEIGGTS